MPLLGKWKFPKSKTVECLPEEPQKKPSKREIAESLKVQEEARRYNELMFMADYWMESKYGETKEKKLDILDYLIESLVEELCSCGAVDPWINSRTALYQNGYPQPFPVEYRDQNGEWIKIYSDEKTEVNLATTKIYVHPWNNERTLKSLFHLKNTDFEYDEHNHISYYFTDLNFCYVYNGNHSINMGRYMKKGTIMSNVCDMDILYSGIRTDGAGWYLKNTETIIWPDADDYRLPAIFTLAQRRYELRNS